MTNNKKNNKKNIEELNALLDNESPDDSYKKNKYLNALHKRMRNKYPERIIIKKTILLEKENDSDSLKPKVIIHTAKEEKIPVTPKHDEQKIFIQPTIEEEDIFEIEKIKIPGPQFLKIKPKITEKN